MSDICAVFLRAHAAVGLPLAPMYVRRLCCAVPRGTSALCVDVIFGWIQRVYGFCSSRGHRRLFANSAACFFLHVLRLRITASARFRADDGVPNALYCHLHCV